MNLINKYLSIEENNQTYQLFQVLDNNKIKSIFFNEQYTLNYDLSGNTLQIFDDNQRVLFKFIYNESLSNDYNYDYIFFNGYDEKGEDCTLMAVDSIPRLWNQTTRYQSYHYIKSGLIKSVGEHTYGAVWAIDKGPNSKIEIGDYCSFAPTLTIVLEDHTYKNISTYPFDTVWNVYGPNDIPINNHTVKNETLRIGNDVWIAHDVKILPGVSYIGDGAIIAAGAVVTRDVEPYSIVGGVPAKLIKYRFTQEQIEALLKIRWWEWDEKTIKERIQDIVSSDIEAFIEKYKKEEEIRND